MAQTWLWIGVISMALGSVFFGFGAHNAKNEAWSRLYTLNFFICLIASALYLAMALGQGQSTVYERPTAWARYVTWSLSTPLLILVLGFLGRSRLSLLCSLLGANSFMIATGFVAAFSPDPINYIWYVVSCVAYLAIVYMLLVPYQRDAVRQRPRNQKSFTKLVVIHLILWTGYPIVWILAPSGIDTFGQGYETMFYTLLDIASKVGFGFLSLNTFGKIERAGEVSTNPAAQPSLR
ncbi:MAG: bacteriorhodopsin [Cyanobacteria bacterium Co-bin8]|nr:bacteriorhodopsin [Cyanobacteria bacterium Co-bin8]